jgi:hypothetical protein
MSSISSFKTVILAFLFRHDDQKRLLPLRPGVAPAPTIAYQTARVLAGDVYVSGRQVVAGARGFPASGCGGRERRKVEIQTKAEKGRTWWHGYSRSDCRLHFDVVDFTAGQNCDEAHILRSRCRNAARAHRPRTRRDARGSTSDGRIIGTVLTGKQGTGT